MKTATSTPALMGVPALSEGGRPLLETHTDDGRLKPAHERLSTAAYLLCNVSAVLTLLAGRGEIMHSESADNYASACELLAKVSEIATNELLEISAEIEKDGRDE